MYVLCVIALTLASLAVRLAFIDSYPFGFSQHAVVHATLRHRLYEAIFTTLWDARTWEIVRDVVIQEQHGPQSLVEALLIPLFGFGFTESRLIVAFLGLLSLILIVAWGSVAMNRWFGLLVGLTIGMAPYALYFSRYGDSEHVNIYLQGFLLLYAAQRSVQRGFVRDYTLLGVAAGLSVYVYATNQLLCALVISLVALFQFVPLVRGGWKHALSRIVTCAAVALIIGGPMIAHHLKTGRTLLLRTPYGSPNYEFSKGHDISGRLLKLWNDLFVQGGDPWFARPHGSLADYTLLLLIPGVITMVVFLRRGLGPNTRAFSFLCAVTLALVLFGGLPAMLSPEPVVRRAVLLALGLDIVKAFGCYGLALLVVRRAPKIIAYAVVAILTVGYAAYDWRSFFFDSRAFDSSSGNSPVETIKYVRETINKGKEAAILLPQGQGFLVRDDFIFFLKFHLGYPTELPSAIKILDPRDLASGPVRDAIVPFTNYQQIKANPQLLPEGIFASRPRISSNRQGETFVLVDFVRAVPATQQ